MDDQFSSSQPKLLIDAASFPGAHIALSADNNTVEALIEKIVSGGYTTLEFVDSSVLLNQCKLIVTPIRNIISRK